jgi:hypothetical protein
MKPLESKFDRKGYKYTLIKRTKEFKGEKQCDIALFKIELDKRIIGYEVFKVIKQKETTLNFGKASIHYEAMEKPPADSAWGRDGFSYCPDELTAAEAKYAEMIKEQKNPTPKRRGRKKKVI